MLLNLKKIVYFFSLFLYSHFVFAFDGFYCIGADPFWKLSLSEQKFTFTQKNTTTSTMPSVQAKPSENMSLDHMRTYRTKLDGKDVLIVIQKQSCTDGTSEEVFNYEGLFITNDKVFHGCCSKKMLLS